MKTEEIKSVQNQAQTMSTIYRELKYVCAKQAITTRRALREAMRIWLEKEQGESLEDLNRYRSLKKDLELVMKAIRFIVKCGDEVNDENIWKKFKEAYSKAKDIAENL